MFSMCMESGAGMMEGEDGDRILAFIFQQLHIENKHFLLICIATKHLQILRRRLGVLQSHQLASNCPWCLCKHAILERGFLLLVLNDAP